MLKEHNVLIMKHTNKVRVVYRNTQHLLKTLEDMTNTKRLIQPPTTPQSELDRSRDKVLFSNSKSNQELRFLNQRFISCIATNINSVLIFIFNKQKAFNPLIIFKLGYELKNKELYSNIF